jgi:hypothetical protein
VNNRRAAQTTRSVRYERAELLDKRLKTRMIA